MTDAELDHLEALFRNPPSMGVLAEHGLALIAHIREASRPVVVDVAKVDTLPLETSGVIVVDSHAAPTPPQHPRAKKKGGSHGP